MDAVHDDLWPYVVTLLPTDVEAQARATGALRRARGVANAVTLLRLVLAYGVSRLSLKGVVAWAAGAGVSTLSAPALYYRLRDSAPWLSAVLAAVLSRELAPVTGPAGYRLRALDATSLSGPGATGTDWRVHALADPTTGRLIAVEVTDRFQGESFARVPLQSGDLVLADRGYAHARGILAAVRAQADGGAGLTPRRSAWMMPGAIGPRPRCWPPRSRRSAPSNLPCGCRNPRRLPRVGNRGRWPTPAPGPASGSRPFARARAIILSGCSPRPPPTASTPPSSSSCIGCGGRLNSGLNA